MTMAPTGEAGDRLVRRIFGAGFLFLLVWTVGVHLATFAALPFWALYLVGAAAVGAGVFGALRPHGTLLKRGELCLPVLSVAPEWRAGMDRNRMIGAGGLALAFLIGLVCQYKATAAVPFVLVCLLGGGLALFVSARGPALPVHRQIPRDTGASTDRVFLVLTGILLLFYLVTSVPDPDDSLFLNLAVGAKERREAIFALDTMVGLPSLEMIKSTYRLESYQLLAALVSDVTRIPVLVTAHTILPLAMIVWGGSVLTLVLAALVPHRLGLAAAILALLLVAMDGTLQSFGYHAIPRFFQGKGPFVALLVPLVVTLTAAALWRRSVPALIALCGAIVISLGLTANAVYAGPLAAALIGAAYFFTAGRDRWVALRLAAIVAYPALLVLWLLIADPPGPSEHMSVGTVGGTVWAVFGSAPFVVIGLGVLFVAAIAALLGASFRAVTIYVLCALVVIWNPVLWPIYGDAVTGNVNYRLFWAIPIPLLLTLFLVLAADLRPRIIAPAVLAVLGALALLGPGSILRHAAFGPSLTKVPRAEMAVAREVSAVLAPDDLLLAPEAISAWIPVLERRPAVVEGRGLYSPQRTYPQDPAILEDRAALHRALNGQPRQFASTDAFIDALNRAQVSAVLLDPARIEHRRLQAELAARGFSEAGPYDGFVLMRRSRPAAAGR